MKKILTLFGVLICFLGFGQFGTDVFTIGSDNASIMVAAGQMVATKEVVLEHGVFLQEQILVFLLVTLGVTEWEHQELELLLLQFMLQEEITLIFLGQL